MNGVGYIRISPRGNGYDGVSLEAQTNAIKQYCAFKGIELLAIYGDKFVSGKEIKNRPGINSVLLLAAEQKIESVIVLKLDRFMRNTIETLDTCAFLEDRGIKFISLHEDINTNSATGRFFLTVLAALGQMEREQVSERTKMALNLKREKGERWGTVPIGFRVQKGSKKLIPDTKDYECYLRLEQLKEAKIPYQSWEDIIYAEGFRNKYGRKRKFSDLWRLRNRFNNNEIEDIWDRYLGRTDPDENVTDLV